MACVLPQRPEPALDKPLLSIPDHVLKPDEILAAFDRRPIGGHVKGETMLAAGGQQLFQFFFGKSIHRILLFRNRAAVPYCLSPFRRTASAFATGEH